MDYETDGFCNWQYVPTNDNNNLKGMLKKQLLPVVEKKCGRSVLWKF